MCPAMFPDDNDPVDPAVSQRSVDPTFAKFIGEVRTAAAKIRSSKTWQVWIAAMVPGLMTRPDKRAEFQHLTLADLELAFRELDKEGSDVDPHYPFLVAVDPPPGAQPPLWRSQDQAYSLRVFFSPQEAAKARGNHTEVANIVRLEKTGQDLRSGNGGGSSMAVPSK